MRKTGDPIKVRFKGVCQPWSPHLHQVFTGLGVLQHHWSFGTAVGWTPRATHTRGTAGGSQDPVPGGAAAHGAASAPRAGMNKCAGMSGLRAQHGTSMWKLFIARAAAGPALPPPTSWAGVAALCGASGAPAWGGGGRLLGDRAGWAKGFAFITSLIFCLFLSRAGCLETWRSCFSPEQGVWRHGDHWNRILGFGDCLNLVLPSWIAWSFVPSLSQHGHLGSWEVGDL